MQRLHKSAGLVITLGILAVMFSLLTSTLKAQSSYGSLVGTVTDTSGATVANATVTLINTGTNDKKTVESDASGNYRFVNLLPADYKLEVSAAGYKGFSRSPIPVQVSSTVRVDTSMEVGAVTETVEVTTQPPLLQTDSGTLGSMVEGKTVEEMPLNGRNPMNLISLVPGVIPQGSSQGSTSMNQGSHTNNQGWGNYQIGGGIAGQSAIYVDGAPINMLGGNSVGLVPTQDIVQEFKVGTNAVSAEFGRFAGGVVEMSTKSGTNAWHGSAYEYLRNNVFNANDFFSKAATPVVPRAKWNQNQYGYVINGPIKKDKAFFVVTYEALKSVLGLPMTAGVPSYNMEQGIIKKIGTNKAVTDPTGNCTGITYKDASGALVPVTGAVVTSIIPQSCFDTTASILLGLWLVPSASTPDVASFTGTPPVGSNQFQYNGRVDYNLNQSQRFFARYTYWNLEDSSPYLLKGSKINSGKAYSNNYTQQAVLGDTYTINPTTVLDVRASYIREFYDNHPPTLGADPATYGAGYAALAPQMSFSFNPRLGISGANNLSLPGMNTNSGDYYETYSLTPSLVKIKGNHTLKFGGEGRLMVRSGWNGTALDQAGAYTFNAATCGDEFACFLMGTYQSASITTVNKLASYNYSEGYYATDTWQMNRNLTFNLGLRWEMPGNLAEKKDRATVILPNTVDPVTGKMGAVVLVNSNLYPSRSVEPFKKLLFAPRLSFAYRLGSSTVIRGGYGLTYLPPDIVAGSLATGSPVNAANTSITTTQYHGMQNPFGALTGGKIQQPTGRTATNFITGFQNQAITSPVPTDRFPYAQQWNFSISREIRGDWMLEVGYAGAKGTHLPASSSPSINQLPDNGNFATLQTMLTGFGASPSTTQKNALIAAGNALRPFPYFKNLTNTAAYIGSTTYNSLQVKSQKRFHNGGMLLAMYTWAKMIGDTDTNTGFLEPKAGGATTGSLGSLQNYNDIRGDRSILGYDAPHRAVVNYVLPLPFGKGRKYLNGASGIADKMISGWAVNGITTFQSGFPIGIWENSGNYLSVNFGSGAIRPNIVAGCNETVSGSRFEKFQKKQFFNDACFAFPGQFAFGNAPRNDGKLRAQGTDNFDFSVLKSTKIRERIDVQFRAEFFNLFNHPQFSPPGVARGGSFYNQVSSMANQPRLGQFSLRLNF